MTKEDIIQLSEEEIISRCCMTLDLRISGVGTINKHEFVYEVEEKIISIFKTQEYALQLENIVNYATYSQFNLIHASPIDRLRAAIMVLEGVKEE